MPGLEQRRFRINTPTVAAEAIDDEVIVINLETGTYYSLLDTGPAVWEQLDAGATVGDVSERLRLAHAADAAEVNGAVDAFVAALEEEGLIVPDEGVPSPASTSPVDHSTEADRSQAFAAPRLERYIDLQNLIQLDPILAIDEHGWPVAEQQQP